MRFKPYTKYKPSGVEWLGVVPEHWQPLKMKYLASIQNGKEYKDVETYGDGYPVIGSGGEFATAVDYLYEGESVLLGRKGTIDRPIYFNGAFWVVDTMFYTQIKKNVVPKYLYYCTTTIHFDYYSTSTALPSMTQRDLSGILFAVPLYEEQSAIASFLDRETAKIDTLIAKQEKLIKLLKEKRQAMISHAVTKGLNPNAKMKDSGIEWLGEVPEHWEVNALKRDFRVIGGSTPKSDYENYWDGSIIWVTPADLSKLSSFKIDDSQRKITADGLQSCGTTLVPCGSIILSTRAPIGSLAIADSELCTNQGCKALVPGDNSNSHFYAYLLSVATAELNNRGKGTTFLELSGDELGSFKVTFPTALEQSAIASFLDRESAKIDTLIAKAEQAITLQKEHRTALISAAVTGKIDVRKAA